MAASTAILWFRRDLRLADNPALGAALASHPRVVPVYIHAPGELAQGSPGQAGAWWLGQSLRALDKALRECGSRLVLRQGPSIEALRELIDRTGARAVYWNRLYEPAAVARDGQIKQALRESGIEVESFNAALLNEPWEVTRKDGSPYRVFTPYWRACVKAGLNDTLQAMPAELPGVARNIPGDKTLLDRLRVPSPKGMTPHGWHPGEAGAQAALERFIDEALAHYREARERPDLIGTARLSPHLHVGEIGARQLLFAVRRVSEGPDAGAALRSEADAWVRQLGWRDFAYQVLYHFPHTVERPLDTRFEDFAWEGADPELFKAWRDGNCGIPIIDAGMRELKATGWMHNRVRMIVASFLTKNLLIPWQRGERWFWERLVDADLANNCFGWQWSAGCGADAAPYFRIFNPVRQGERFDPRGDYVRRWVPEIAALPDKYLQAPWTAPAKVLDEAGITGKHYPKPIVDLAGTRERALMRYKDMRSGTRD